MSIDATADHPDPLDREPDGTADLIGVTLRRIDPAKNMARFYAMEVQLDLFGAIMLMKQWGRLGTSGRIAGEPYASVALAKNALERQAARKRRRGYQKSLWIPIPQRPCPRFYPPPSRLTSKAWSKPQRTMPAAPRR